MPRDICGDFILLFVGSRKCQLTYSKVRKVNVLLLIELVLSHRFTYNTQIIFKLLLLCLYLIPYITAMQERIIHRMDVAINYFLNHSFHCLQIFHLRPALFQTPTDLINCTHHPHVVSIKYSPKQMPPSPLRTAACGGWEGDVKGGGGGGRRQRRRQEQRRRRRTTAEYFFSNHNRVRC